MRVRIRTRIKKKKVVTQTEELIKLLMFIIVSGVLMSLSVLMWAIIDYLVV